MPKLTKAQAGRLGGLATVRRYGREYMRKIGRKGAAVTWARYGWVPYGTSDFALVENGTGRVVTTQFGYYDREGDMKREEMDDLWAVPDERLYKGFLISHELDSEDWTWTVRVTNSDGEEFGIWVGDDDRTLTAMAEALIDGMIEGSPDD